MLKSDPTASGFQLAQRNDRAAFSSGCLIDDMGWRLMATNGHGPASQPVNHIQYGNVTKISSNVQLILQAL